MSRARLLVVALAASIGVRAVATRAQQATFQAGVQTVAVYATVQNAQGRLVSDLTRADFQIRDNGRPVPIAIFSNDPQPITVALLVDMSGSMTSRFLRVREGMLDFIESLEPGDRVRLGSFGQEIALSPILTGDKAVLERIAREELWPGGDTPMWNAVFAAETSLSNEPGRRVVLVLTDGYDTGGLSGHRGSSGDVKRRAAEDGDIVYAVGLGEDELSPDMGSLTAQTGGGHFQVPDSDTLTATFAEVADELRHQYVLGFAPALLDGKEHSLQISGPHGLKVRARQSYIAK